MICVNIFWVLMFFYWVTRFALSYQFLNCGSNRINEVHRNGMKSVIKYDATKKIDFDKSGQNVTIWCVSKMPVQSCNLFHLSSQRKYEKVCDYRYPIPCSLKQNYLCQNKRISFEPINEYKCGFTFDMIELTGMWDILSK